MRGTHTCSRCERRLRLTKTGAVPAHTYSTDGGPRCAVDGPAPVVQANRKLIDAEVKRWLADPSHVVLLPAKVTFKVLSNWCSEKAYYPRA